MRYKRLQWIAKAIEFRRLEPEQLRALLNYVEAFKVGKDTKTAEKEVEQRFKDVQWEEDKEPIHFG
jgi:hypothetical protein